MTPGYAELHCLSNFSFLRGASHPEELVAMAHELGYAALAITDECSLAGIVRAHIAAKDKGLKLIIGAEMTLDADAPAHHDTVSSRCPTRLVLLVTDRESYGNLCALITAARRRTTKGSYRLSRADIENRTHGLLAILLPPRSSGEHGDTGASIATFTTTLTEQASWLGQTFADRAWLAVEMLGMAGDRARLAATRTVAARLGLDAVACGDVHMHIRERRELQDTLTAIRLKCTLAQAGLRLFTNAERHLRPRERLQRIYPPELLDATLAITGRCNFSLDTLRYEYPAELVPAGNTPASHLRKLTAQGFRWRFGADLDTGDRGPLGKVRTLIEHELKLVAELGYEPYFLTVHDIVRFARTRGILCQGRGSAANSAVCYCLGITEVDPARMQMLFERFVSKERNEPPDIDVDFEHQRREEVMQYVYEKYGRDRAALAATVISYRMKSACRDVGKALGLAPAQVDRLAKSLAWWDKRDALTTQLDDAGLNPESPLVRRLITLTGMLLGFPRHLSQHVGGLVISRGPLERMVPIENAAMRERTVIEWDKDDLDALGMLKVDCLALGMLSAIRRALALVSQVRGRSFGMTDVPAEDPAVYSMIRKADTIGVFQIESRAQMSMLPRLAPRTFYDLVIEVAIVRPGPIQGGMVHPYLRRRQGIEPVTYPSDAVKQVLERTLGVPIFQEQVMQLAIVASGFSPGEADRLRRSMAAWRRKGDLWQFEARLIDGMRSRGYTEAFGRQIFQQILGFGEYGFPESHSASFALLVYVSAWLKCHEPAAFTCALLNSQPMGFYAPSQLVQDATRHGVEVKPVDVTISNWDCTLEKKGQARILLHSRQRDRGQIPSVGSAPGLADAMAANDITPDKIEPGPFFPDALRLGMRMVNGLSEAAAGRIVRARARQAFVDTQDLARRAKLDRHDLHALARAGALETLAGHRREALWHVTGTHMPPPLFEHVALQEERATLAPPTEAQDIVADYGSLGLTLRRHPLALLRAELTRRRLLTAKELCGLTHGKLARAAGIVTGRQRPDTASGVIFVTLEDETGHTNVVVWRTVAERQRRQLLGARLLAVYGTIEREGDVVHLVAAHLIDLSELLGTLVPKSRDFH